MRQTASRLQARTTAVEDPEEGKLEPNPWLRRVGWAAHLAGFDPAVLRGMASLVAGDGWPASAGQGVAAARAAAAANDVWLLQLAWESTSRTIGAAQAACEYEAAGAAVLFEVNRKTVGEKPHKPFDGRLELRTTERYANLWKRIVAYLLRSQAWPASNRPPYRLTPAQEAALAAFRAALLASAAAEEIEIEKKKKKKKTKKGGVRRKKPGSAQLADRACLDLLISLLDHPLLGASYDSVLLSALAVVGIRDDGGWVTPDNYTGYYSAVIKVARMLVVRQAQVEEGEAEAAEAAEGTVGVGGRPGSAAAERGLFLAVRAKVRRFMTTVHADGFPTPIDWVFESRSYGLRIRYTTAMTGLLYWEGSTVVFRQVRFAVEAFSEMLHCLVGELARTMDSLVLLPASRTPATPATPAPATSDTGSESLPGLDWTRLYDDTGTDTIGYSFLTDPRNDWLASSRGWVVERILADPTAKADWLVERGGDLHFCPAAVADYLRRVGRFRSLLLAAVHFLGGQPARTTELLGLRYLNTAYGGRRNVFIQHGMVCLAFGYHKGYSQSGQLKVIHRYLPRELGELFVRYLWLVLPFCQLLEALSAPSPSPGAASSVSRPSPYLWSSAFVQASRPRPEKGRRTTGGSAGDGDDDDDDDESGPSSSRGDCESSGDSSSSSSGDGSGDCRSGGEAVGHRGRQVVRRRRRQAGDAMRVWSSDKMRRIVQDLAARHLGTKLNISSWRHIAIAISRKYLRGYAGGPPLSPGARAGPASVELATYDDSETDGEDSVPNNVWDLQAGHSSHTAEMVYGREALQGSTGLAARQEQFRQVSQAWHCFLGFGPGASAATAMPREAPGPQDVEGHLVRTRRLARLSKVDLDSLLRQLLGSPHASFRGSQRAAVEAVVRGHSPILQVASTGGGKSLTFLLPSYAAASGGCTVVVVPFVALQQDIQERCGRLAISCDIWSPREVCTAAIVLVTPEVLATKQFRDFANRLSARHQLDRVVFDECHAILDASYGFRPQLRAIGLTLQTLGAQLVFLTATLPPRDEAEFFATLHLDPGKALVVRGRTDRPNIGYSVVAVPGSAADEDRAAVRLVGEALGWSGGRGVRSSGGGSSDGDDGGEQPTASSRAAKKVVVYCQQVARAGRIARLLACPVYHSQAGSSQEKARVVRQWAAGGGAIVATSALGAGIDIPDVRLVVHVGLPRSLRDFAQESGRAGRDGQPSRSTIVVAQHRCRTTAAKGDSSKLVAGAEVVAARLPASGDDMAEFIRVSPFGCRRTILSWVIDGNCERVACQDDEQACDLCLPRRPLSRTAPECGEGADDVDLVAADPDHLAELERGPGLGTWGQALDSLARTAEQARAVTRRGGQETDGFVRALDFWAANCVVCLTATPAPERYQAHRYCFGNKDPDAKGSRREMWEAVRERIRTAKANQYRPGSGAA